jgi:hypothetical protein
MQPLSAATPPPGFNAHMALSSCAVETTKPCFRDTAASAAVPQAAGMAAASGSRSSRQQAPGDQCTMKGGSPPSSIFENNPFHRSALCLLTGYPQGRSPTSLLLWARLIAHNIVQEARKRLGHIEQEARKLYGGQQGH